MSPFVIGSYRFSLFKHAGFVDMHIILEELNFRKVIPPSIELAANEYLKIFNRHYGNFFMMKR